MNQKSEVQVSVKNFKNRESTRNRVKNEKEFLEI